MDYDTMVQAILTAHRESVGRAAGAPSTKPCCSAIGSSAHTWSNTSSAARTVQHMAPDCLPTWQVTSGVVKLSVAVLRC